MIVMVKSAPDTADGIRGVALARDGNADLVLLQNGVVFAQKKKLDDLPGAVYVLDDDKRLRGMNEAEMDERVQIINYDQLTDLIMESDKVVGMF
jgi:sulfur relay protein TusB/DsrH